MPAHKSRTRVDRSRCPRSLAALFRYPAAKRSRVRLVLRARVVRARERLAEPDRGAASASCRSASRASSRSGSVLSPAKCGPNPRSTSRIGSRMSRSGNFSGRRRPDQIRCPRSETTAAAHPLGKLQRVDVVAHPRRSSSSLFGYAGEALADRGDAGGDVVVDRDADAAARLRQRLF